MERKKIAETKERRKFLTGKKTGKMSFDVFIKFCKVEHPTKRELFVQTFNSFSLTPENIMGDKFVPVNLQMEEKRNS